MKLDEILNILDPVEACKVAGCGKSAYWHWYKTDDRRKVPDMAVLVKWADHLKLSDADLGELIRDAYNMRIKIMEQLAKNDKSRIKPRSVLRRDLKSEILSAEKKKAEPNLKSIAEVTKIKEELEEERLDEERRQEKLKRYEEKLKRLRRK
jgi:putative cell wall-binding protein